MLLASGWTRLPSASPWYVKASSAPWAESAQAIPQAIEWSLATPMTRPRLPLIRLKLMPPAWLSSCVDVFQNDRGVGAAKSKRIRQNRAEADMVAPGENNGIFLKTGASAT